MKDAAPRIFRSLERQSGQQEFDTVVTAAVSAYGSLRHPSQRQSEDLARLVTPLWARIADETRRGVGAVLSHSPRVPRGIVELLIAAPIEISAPFLVSSPTLSDADLLSLQQSGDERVARLVDKRLSRPTSVPDPLPEPTLEAEPPPAARTLPESPSLSPEFLAETPLLEPRRPVRRSETTVDAVREALRRLALTGRSPSTGAPAPARLEDLVALAMDREDARFYEGLASALSLSDKILATIMEDASGERLAVALKALAAKSADAMSILMMLKPAIGLDVRAFDRLALYYRTLKVEDCRSMVSASRLHAHRHQPVAAPESVRAVVQPRREFGRRVERPAPREAEG
ncbi:hypothetical protein [Aureimonas sp. ME7]|uniref:hypothetical protein n=1 Tax=Aureimonas sp. ME7 TaxID=2744252 RepID=UPI0015F5AAA0|nr:hypothetical protein [Aureimonas sp. ME7]